VKTRFLILIGVTAALWVVVAFPARWLWGDGALSYSAVAMVICLVPASATLFCSAWAHDKSADKQLTMLLGGTGLRLFMVLAAGFGLYQFVPYFSKYQSPGFLVWLGLFYVFTLMLETALSLAGRSSPPAVPAE
jgi:hypothetical protein